MSRYFVLPEEGIGPGGDIIFRHHSLANSYRLFVGEQFFGLTFINMGHSWSSVSWAESSEFFGVDALEGFATRLDAATFVIKHHGYWMNAEREARALAAKMEKRS